jgi:hypothetical protein
VALGLVLLAGGATVTVHAADAPTYRAGDAVDVGGAGVVHVVGAGEGDARCSIGTPSRSVTVEVGSRVHRLDSIPAGRRLPVGDQQTVTCDRAVAVTTGPLVHAYGLASVPLWYAVYASLAVAGLIWFLVWRWLARPRVRRQVSPPPDSPASAPPVAEEQPLPAPVDMVAGVSGPAPAPGSQDDVLRELAYGDPHVAFARMRSQAGRGLRAYLVFALALVGSTVGLTFAIVVLVVWPLSLLTGRWEPAPILLVIPGTVTSTYLAMRRWAEPK